MYGPFSAKQSNFHMKDFAAIDFETANQHRSSVCSVGIVIVKNDIIVDRFYRLIKPSPNFYCTLQASRRYFPRLENHQLHTVSAHVGYILDNHHHALADAEACAEIALKLQML